MSARRFVVMGAGEVGFHLARTLDESGHDVVIIDKDLGKRARIEEELDVNFLVGSGTEVPVLQRAGVDGCELFIAASDSEDANLASALLAKDFGAQRSVVRLETPEDVTTYRATYERVFRADLLLAPQQLATIEVANSALGHNTHEIDFLARGRIQLRTIEIQEGSQICRQELRQQRLPRGSLIVGYRDPDHDLAIPTPEWRPSPGDHAIVLCTQETIRDVERLFSATMQRPDLLVIAGGGMMGQSVAHFLRSEVRQIKIFESNRDRATRCAQALPGIDVIHADATDVRMLQSERVHQADCFVAAMGHDESNLMAGLVAQEIGVENVVATVRRTETSRLWEKAGAFHLVSPRYLAAKRIGDYIRNGYKSNLISLEGGALQALQRRIYAASPVVGVSLAELKPPRGLLVGAIVRGDRVFVPSGRDRLAAGDLVLLFVHVSELATVQLFFPGSDEDA